MTQSLLIKESLQNTFNNYSFYAWGHDVLYNQSGKQTLYSFTTPIAFLSTLYIAGSLDEFYMCKSLVLHYYRPKWMNTSLPTCELITQHLGGLLSAYELESDWAFIQKAIELADITLNAFETVSGIPLLNFELVPYPIKEIK